MRVFQGLRYAVLADPINDKTLTNGAKTDYKGLPPDGL
jgi:hypothetical protein